MACSELLSPFWVPRIDLAQTNVKLAVSAKLEIAGQPGGLGERGALGEAVTWVDLTQGGNREQGIPFVFE